MQRFFRIRLAIRNLDFILLRFFWPELAAILSLALLFRTMVTIV
jgi:hypothetical protein